MFSGQSEGRQTAVQKSLTNGYVLPFSGDTEITHHTKIAFRTHSANKSLTFCQQICNTTKIMKIMKIVRVCKKGISHTLFFFLNKKEHHNDALNAYIYLLTAFFTGTAIADAAMPPITASGRPFVSTTIPRNARSVCEPSATAIE